MFRSILSGMRVRERHGNRCVKGRPLHVRPWRVLAAAAFFIAPTFTASAVAQDTLFTVHGQRGDQAGWIVDGGADADGDGYADFVMGTNCATHGPHSNGSLSLYSGRTGLLIHQWNGTLATECLGYAAAFAGDVDADGFADVIAGSCHDPTAGLFAGSATVYSGATGGILYKKYGSGPAQDFGLSVSTARDTDDDGYSDFAVGAPGHPASTSYAGSAHIYSGASGAEIRTYTGASPYEFFGWYVNSVGDMDGDGRPELAVGAPFKDAGLLVDAGMVRVYSGASGAVLQEHYGSASDQWLGISVASAGDVNGDAYTDLVAGATQGWTGLEGIARVYSGLSATVIHELHGAEPADGFGISVDSASDVDLDGRGDFVVGAWNASVAGLGAGRVRVFSGASGLALLTWDGAAPGDRLGASVASGGDVNDDGASDLVLGADRSDVGGEASGSVRVVSTKPLALTGEPHWLSLGSGGQQILALKAGPTHGGALHFLLMSEAGTQPGIPVGSVTLPLNAGLILSYSASAPNQPPLAGSLGTLSGLGKASATFTLPAGTDPALAGLGLDLAYLLLEGGTITLASNPVPLALLP
ncbi:MAG: hypothetical protein FJ299_03820 [Planctomycetes bacterium]|nr:hypothetical protein [Planctomycetota bacterium]